MMMKMLIELDEEKIVQDVRFDVNKINRYISDLFRERNMVKDSDNWYINGDFSKCGSIIAILSKKEWFREYVTRWLWYDPDDGSIEDLREHYRKNNNIL